LNKKYRGQDRPTDVLAFPLSLDPGTIKAKRRGMPHWLGDVVISVETARLQAREFGHSLDEEMGRLLIHGTLHLIGYDHERPEDARRMQRKERALIRQLLKTS
jgi:probable rRNA maturation factor